MLYNSSRQSWRNFNDNIQNDECLVPECGYNIKNSISDFKTRVAVLSHILNKNWHITYYLPNTSSCDENTLQGFDNGDIAPCDKSSPCFTMKSLYCMGEVKFSLPNCLRIMEIPALFVRELWWKGFAKQR